MKSFMPSNLPGVGIVVAGLLVLALLGVGAARMRAQVPARPDLAAQAKAALAQLSGTIIVRGLSEPVEVLRDTWGIPHIYAKSTADLFFAQGYVVAQDRMWQLEMWRRNGEGRLAEVLGPEYVTRDRFARLLTRSTTRRDAGSSRRSPRGSTRRSKKQSTSGKYRWSSRRWDSSRSRPGPRRPS